jgi:hypothetical protein
MFIKLAWVLALLASLTHIPIAEADSDFPGGAAIIAAAAVVAAGIAAYTAQRRLVAQLGHDRGMRDLEELRQILDEAAHLAAKAVGQTENAFFSIQNYEQGQDDEVRAAKQLVEEMGAMHQRLRLRLGGDPVAGAYFFAMRRLEQAVEDLEANIFSSPSNQDLSSASADIDAHKESFQQFMQFALARAGIDAAGEPSPN